MKLTTICVLITLAPAAPRPAAAATRTWTGAAIGSPFWNNITNWTGFALPANGDSVFFPVSAGNKSSVNNLSVTNYGTVFLGGSNYSFVGGTLGLSGGIVATNRDGTNTFAAPVVLRAAQTFSNGFGPAVAQFASLSDLNGHGLAWAGSGDFRVLSLLIGSGDMTKDGAGELLLSASNTFTGQLILRAGTARLGHNSGLGDTNAGTVISNASLRLNPGVSVTNESLELGLFSDLTADGGTNTWAGPVTVTDFAATFSAPGNSAVLRVHGAVLDPNNQGLSISGPGTVIFSGSQANSANGEDIVSSGATWILDKPPGVPATQSRLRVIQGSTVRLNVDEQLATRTVVLSDESALDLNNHNETIAFPADWPSPGTPPGRVLLGSSGTNVLTLGGAGFTNFSGTVSGAGSVLKSGSGTWILQGTNSITGTTTVRAGSLIVDGRVDTSLLLITNGLLGGTGRVAAVTVNAANSVVNPGLGTNTTGRLRVAGAFSLLAGKLQLELNGTNAVALHDQVQADAPMFLTNASLQVAFGFTPTNGDRFVIVTNTTAGPINGHFANLPEGGLLNVGGRLLRLTYLGGDGNDIVLTVVTQPVTGVTRTWSGGGANSRWLTPANWVGGTRPQGGDSLYFPPGAARLGNTNDFPPDTVFNSMSIGASGYNLRGNGVSLLGGLTATNAVGASFVGLPITLATNQTIAMTRSGGTLNFSGAIDGGTNDVTFNTVGAAILSGPITGTGRLVKIGTNQLSLLGTNALTGTNFINEGSLAADGAVVGRVMLAPGTTLNGSGFIGRLQSASGSRVTPGDSASPARLTLGDELRLTNGSVFVVKLNGPGPGAGYDQIAVTNTASTVVLSNATLQAKLNFTPLAGDTFTIIDKAGAGAIAGTFNGLSEGSLLQLSNVLFRVSYAGGTGHDVVLTALFSGPTGIMDTWTGAAYPNTNWSNPTNWAATAVPGAGDALFFSGTLTNLVKTNVYDLPAGTAFDQLVFAEGQCRYRIFGTTPLLLADGIVVTNATFGPSFTVPLELLADQSFSNAGPSGLRVTAVMTDGHQLTLEGDGSFVVDGDISGAGDVVKRGAGPMTLNGSSTSTGLFTVEQGGFVIGNNAAFGSATVGTVAGSNGAISFVGVTKTIAEPLVLAGTLNAQNRSGDRWTGPITVNAPGGTVNADANGSLTISGVISGHGALNKTGHGALTLSATNPLDGPRVLQAGTLFVNGIDTNGALTVNAAGTLGGTGLVASVTADGSLAPGVANSPGVLRVSGDLSLNPGSTLVLDLDGLTPGTGHDQLVVSGNVQLAGNPPNISLGFTPALGDTFFILRNDGTNAVSGTFAGVPQGGTFISGAANWQANYAGGDGNDLTLTAVPFVPSGLTSVWTGAGGPNFFWTNASNWAGNIVPGSGNDLVFPGTANGKLNTNNLPPDVVFNSIRFSTGVCSYFLFSTTDLKLISGITVTNATFAPAIVAPVRLLADQVFRAYDRALFLSDIALNGHELTCDTPNSIVVGGISGVPATEIISGQGTVRKLGPGLLDLQRTNTYTGLTIIEDGTVELVLNGTLGSPADGTIVSNGATLRFSGVLRTNAEPLTLAGSLAIPFGTNFWTGPISLGSANATFDIATNAALRVTNVISGGGGLVKSNGGALILEADDAYSGETRVSGGSLVISNSHLSGPVTLSSNTLFTANGQIGTLTSAGATVGAGTLTTPGLLQVNGALTLDAATRFDVDIDGTLAGTNYDQVRVTGPVNLGSAQLALAITVSAPIGSTFVILRKDSPGAVTGTFAGLPHNATFTRGAFVWQIDYFAIDGNDVALRVISQTFPGVVWDGGGGDSNWLTASNWLSDATPSPGADLIFSNEADQRTNFNNFAAGTTFNLLRFTGITNVGTGFNISGSPLALSSGIVADSNAAFNTLNFDLALGDGATIAADSTLFFGGAISNGGPNLTVSGRSSLIFAGPIRSAGGLVSSAGFVWLRTNNTFTGSILVSTGVVRVETEGVFGSATNGVTVETGAALQLENATNIANPLGLRGSLQAFVTNTWAGPITAQGTNAVIGFAGSGPLTIDGPISGDGEMLVLGSYFGGAVVFNATNPYAGLTRLGVGTLFVNGSHAGGPLHLATNLSPFFGSVILTGTGTVGSVFAGGTVAPGPATNAGVLSVAGSLTLSNTAVLDVQINGPDPGTGHDQLRVAGDVTIQDATLQVAQGGFTPLVGNSFVIVRNDGPHPVAGTFAGLPEGAFITNCAVFQLSYTGGDGNDVALTVTAQKGSSDLWTGGGADANWTTAANWACGLAPTPGDELVFSNTVAQRVVQNDFPAGTTFSRLRLTGFGFSSNFFLGGNALALTDGIVANSFANSNVLSMPITLAGAQTFSNVFNPLIFRGGIANNGHDLALAGGAFDFVGPYSGAGGLSFSNGPFFFGQLNLRTNNPYDGPTAFDGLVAVFVDDPGALGSPASGTYVGSSAQLIVDRPMILAEPMTLAGLLTFARGSNVMAAPLTIAGSNAQLCASGARLELDGALNGAGRIQFCGGVGTNLWNAGGNFTGEIDAFSGRHIIVGQYAGADLRLAGSSFAAPSLEGTGRVGAIHAYSQGTNAIIAPGVDGPGVLTCGGPLVIESNVTLRIELNGTAPGASYDQLVVEGGAALTNCALELSLGFTPALGDNFTILDHRGPNPIAGAFDGLPEGTAFTLSNQLFSITYTGGDGNDVVITRGNPPPRFGSVARSNGFMRLQVLGQPGSNYVVQATTNLVQPPSLIEWTPLGTNTADGAGFFEFLDLASTNFLMRFYRAVLP